LEVPTQENCDGKKVGITEETVLNGLGKLI
jgi:hypothetical protein